MSLSENRFPLFRDERALTPVFADYALVPARRTAGSSASAAHQFPSWLPIRYRQPSRTSPAQAFSGCRLRIPPIQLQKHLIDFPFPLTRRRFVTIFVRLASASLSQQQRRPTPFADQ